MVDCSLFSKILYILAWVAVGYIAVLTVILVAAMAYSIFGERRDHGKD